MSLNRFAVALSALVFAAQLTTVASATTIVSKLNGPGDLSPNDTRFVDKDAPGTVYTGPSVAFNNGNNRLTFSRASGGFETDQVGFNYGASAFSNNTILVGAGGFQGEGDGGPIRITFAVPVIQFGANIEDFDLAGNGTNDSYYTTFTAYNSTGNLLVTSLLSSRGCSDNTCLSFAGLTVSGDSISYIVFDDTQPTFGGTKGSNNLLFGNMAYANAGTALQAPAPVPEPSSIALLGTGILSLAALGRRDKGFLRNRSAR